MQESDAEIKAAEDTQCSAGIYSSVTSLRFSSDFLNVRIRAVVVPMGQYVHHARGEKMIPEIIAKTVAISMNTRIAFPVASSPWGIIITSTMAKLPIISAHRNILNAFVFIKAGFFNPRLICVPIFQIKDPRGQMRAQDIFPRPEIAMMIGVNMHTNPKSPKGFHTFAIAIHASVIIKDQSWILGTHRLPSTTVTLHVLIFPLSLMML